MIAKLFIAITFAVLAGLAVYGGPTLLLTGSFPIRRVESLKGPVEVRGWTAEGFHLASGRTVLPKGFRALPLKSDALTAATQHGLEIAPSGHVYGLIQIWHWCGNDAVRYDLRRIDLGLLLGYLNEGKSDIVADPLLGPYKPGGTFTGHGWSISDLVRFRHFLTEKYPRDAATMKL